MLSREQRSSDGDDLFIKGAPTHVAPVAPIVSCGGNRPSSATRRATYEGDPCYKSPSTLVVTEIARAKSWTNHARAHWHQDPVDDCSELCSL